MLLMGSLLYGEQIEYYTVDRVELISDDQFNHKFWRSFIDIKAGNMISKNQITQVRDRLNATGHFSNIYIQERIVSGENYLYFFLVKEPSIRKVEITGNFPLLKSEVRRKIFFKIGDRFNPDRLDDIKEKIISLYEENGYFNAVVAISHTLSDDGRYVYLKVDIKHIGIELQIGKIYLKVRKHALSAKALKKLKEDVIRALTPSEMEQIVTGFSFNDFKRKLENTRKYLQKRGYLTAKLRSQTLILQNRKKVNVSEGGYSSEITQTYQKQISQQDPYLVIRKRGMVIDYKRRKVDIWIEFEPGDEVTLSFKGFDSLSERTIKEQITLYRMGSVSPSELKSSEERLRRYYQSIGYYFARVSSKSIRKKGHVQIEFQAIQGEKMYIRGITFTGHKHFNSSELLGLMGSGSFSYLGTQGYLQDTLFIKDLKKILDRYREAGYLNASIKGIRFDHYDQRRFLEIDIEIDEGPRSTIDRLSIKGNYQVSLKKLIRVMQRVGETGFDPELFGKNGRMLQQYYHANGYPFANVKQSIETSVGSLYPFTPIPKRFTKEEEIYPHITGKLNLKYDITEGKRVQFGNLFFKGNFNTKIKTLLREIKFERGDTFQYKKLQETRDSIRGLGVFKSVSIKTPRLKSGDSEVDVLFFFEEDENQYIDFSVGTSSDENYSASAEFVERNFLGIAQKISVLGKVGEVYNRGEINFTDPRFAVSFSKKPVTVGSNLKLFYRYETLPAFTLNSYGGSLSFFKNFFKKLGVTLTFQGEIAETNRFNSLNIIDPDIFALKEESITTSMILSVSWEGRNNIFSPRSGVLVRSNFQWANSAFGGGDDFFKYNIDLAYYLPLFSGTILATSFRFGAVIPTNAAKSRIPQKERFFLGGDTTIRGYELNMVGDLENNQPIGNNAMALFNVEIRRHLFGNFWSAFFMDAGGLSEYLSDFFRTDIYKINDDNNIKYTAGIGLRYMTIIGPLRLDLAFKLNNDLHDKEPWRYHFSFSYPF